MYADLVGTAGFQTAFYQRNVSQRFNNAVMGNRPLSLAAVRKGRHYAAVARTSSDTYINGSFGWFRLAPYQSPVSALNGMMKELFSKVLQGLFGFGNYQQAGGILILYMLLFGNKFLGIVKKV
jgi:hypothetical protein